MRSGSNYSGFIFCLFTILSLISSANGTSVYTITYMTESDVQVFDINNDQIEHQMTYTTFPDNGYGAVDLALGCLARQLF